MKHELLVIEELDDFDTPGARMCHVCMACTCCEAEKLGAECPGEWKEERNA